MLSQRITTGVILIIITICSILFLPLFFFDIVVAFIFMLAAWEWSNLSHLTIRRHRYTYLFLISIMTFLVFFVPILLVLWGSLVFWGLVLGAVLIYPKFKQFYLTKSMRLILGFLALIPSCRALIFLKEFDDIEYIIFFVLILIWATDTGAYVVGKRFGKNKLSLISPNKTIEGVFGGVMSSVLFSLIYYSFFDLSSVVLWDLVFAAVLISLVSVLGDLFESMLKRERGMKDSGSILPGHGGVLDRIDSLIAVLPIFTFVLIAYKGFN